MRLCVSFRTVRRKAAEFWADEIRLSQTSYLIREESAGGPAVIRRMLLF